MHDYYSKYQEYLIMLELSTINIVYVIVANMTSELLLIHLISILSSGAVICYGQIYMLFHQLGKSMFMKHVINTIINFRRNNTDVVWLMI